MTYKLSLIDSLWGIWLPGWAAGQVGSMFLLRIFFQNQPKTIIDGTGAPGFVGDLAIEKGKIAAIGQNLQGKTEIPAEGYTVLEQPENTVSKFNLEDFLSEPEEEPKKHRKRGIFKIIIAIILVIAVLISAFFGYEFVFQPMQKTSVYDDMLDLGVINGEIARSLSHIIFTHKVVVFDKKMVKAIIYQRQLKEPQIVPIVDNTAYFQLYSREYIRKFIHDNSDVMKPSDIARTIGLTERRVRQIIKEEREKE